MNHKNEMSYPTVKVEGKNIDYAYILLQDYAGDISEDTAVHLYIYQSLIKRGENEDLANALLKIAITEMHHISLLGQTIKLLGIRPEFKTYSINQTQIPWNASYVSYETDTKKILLFDIEAEKIAIRNYTLHKELIHDKYIRLLIDRIIEDEKEHIQIFESFLKKLNL